MTFDIGIVGLGYVGLILATAFAESGAKVLGIEKRADIVDLTNSGVPHFQENGLAKALRHVTETGALRAARQFAGDDQCDAYVIAVGTPLDRSGQARMDMIREASRLVAGNMRSGALVVLRSTVMIGTTRGAVAPILAESGKPFLLAMCPERTLEGNAMRELRKLPQIIGADTPAAAEEATRLFSRLTNAAVRVDSLEAAEIIKLVDNTYRDVQFGFANEVARLCDVLGVNAHQVISSGNLGYPRTQIALPGLVGGPCLEKDPHILWQCAKRRGLDLEITRAARAVNERQPSETVDDIIDEMARRRLPDSAPIALLGIAFKGMPETDDLRGAMSLRVLGVLKERRPHAPITLYDPVVRGDALHRAAGNCQVAGSLNEALRGAAVGVIANNHPAFGELPPARLVEMMAPGAFIYDYWNHFSELRAAELGNSYFAVGNTQRVKL